MYSGFRQHVLILILIAITYHRTKKRICIKFALCKYVANMSFAPSASVVMAEFARFCANSAIATFGLVAKLCEFHICNIFAPRKFGANSIFRPVYILEFSNMHL